MVLSSHQLHGTKLCRIMCKSPELFFGMKSVITLNVSSMTNVSTTHDSCYSPMTPSTGPAKSELVTMVTDLNTITRSLTARFSSSSVYGFRNFLYLSVKSEERISNGHNDAYGLNVSSATFAHGIPFSIALWYQGDSEVFLILASLFQKVRAYVQF